MYIFIRHLYGPTDTGKRGYVRGATDTSLLVAEARKGWDWVTGSKSRQPMA